MTKTLLHLHLYLYNETLVKVARENLKRFKSYGFKILVTSGLKVPEDFYEFCDYIFIDHENPGFEKEYTPDESVFFFYKYGNTRLDYHHYYQQSHCLAVLNSIVKGCKIAEDLGYENVVKLVYDCNLGPESFAKIKEHVSILEGSEYDMILYENIRPEDAKSDISGQILYYKAKPMLSLFNGYTTEDAYIGQVKALGFGEKILDLERFMYRTLKESGTNVLYHIESKFFDDYPDTKFNMILSTESSSDRSGVLYDVMAIIENNTKSKEFVAISVHNQHSSETNSVTFEMYNENWQLIETKTLTVENYKGVVLERINLTDAGIRHIKTIFKAAETIKFFTIKLEENNLTILSNGQEIHSLATFY